MRSSFRSKGALRSRIPRRRSPRSGNVGMITVSVCCSKAGHWEARKASFARRNRFSGRSPSLASPTAWSTWPGIYLKEGRIPDARLALEQAKNHPKLAAPWVVAWLTGQINERNGYLDDSARAASSTAAEEMNSISPVRGKVPRTRMRTKSESSP